MQCWDPSCTKIPVLLQGMMNYLIKTCSNDLMLNLMQISQKRELDKMELHRRCTTERLRQVGRSLRRRMTGLEKESYESRLNFTQQIDSVSDKAACIDHRLRAVEGTLLEELRQRVGALESRDDRPMSDRAALLAQIEALQALVAAGTARLDKANAEFKELEV